MIKQGVKLAVILGSYLGLLACTGPLSESLSAPSQSLSLEVSISAVETGDTLEQDLTPLEIQIQLQNYDSQSVFWEQPKPGAPFFVFVLPLDQTQESVQASVSNAPYSASVLQLLNRYMEQSVAHYVHYSPLSSMVYGQLTPNESLDQVVQFPSQFEWTDHQVPKGQYSLVVMPFFSTHSHDVPVLEQEIQIY